MDTQKDLAAPATSVAATARTARLASADSQSPIRNFWLEQIGGLRRAIGRLDFTEHEMRVMACIEYLSFGQCRRIAPIPTHSDLAEWTQIRLDHCDRILKGLQRQRVLKVAGDLYGFCLPTSLWAVAERKTVEPWPQCHKSWEDFDRWLRELHSDAAFKGRVQVAMREMFPDDPGIGFAHDLDCDDGASLTGQESVSLISSTRTAGADQQADCARQTRATVIERPLGAEDGDGPGKGLSSAQADGDRESAKRGLSSAVVGVSEAVPNFGTDKVVGADGQLSEKQYQNLELPKSDAPTNAGSLCEKDIYARARKAIPNFGEDQILEKPNFGTGKNVAVPNFGLVSPCTPSNGTVEDGTETLPCSNVPLPLPSSARAHEAAPKSGTAKASRWDEELYQQVVDAMGKDWNPRYRNLWVKMVTLHAEDTRLLLGELRYAKHLREIRNPGGWMLRTWRRWEDEDRRK